MAPDDDGDDNDDDDFLSPAPTLPVCSSHGAVLQHPRCLFAAPKQPRRSRFRHGEMWAAPEPKDLEAAEDSLHTALLSLT